MSEKLKAILGVDFDPRLALGTEQFGKLNLEKELTLYVKLDNLEQIQSLPSEVHEQWRLNVGDGPRMRLRLINGKRHTICSKRPNTSGSGMLEAESDISPAFYNEMLVAFGSHGYKKTRYIYDIPGTELKYEIDVFYAMSGQQHPWVKVDLEYPQTLDTVPQFPFSFSEVIVGSDMSRQDEQLVDRLWEDEWSRLDSAKGSMDPLYQPKKEDV